MALTKEQEIEITKAFAHKYIDYYLDPASYKFDYHFVIPPVLPLERTIGAASSSGKPGNVVTGTFGRGFFITICSKVGTVSLYNTSPADPVYWVCEAEYSGCQTAKDAGFGETSGQIQSIKQLEHIFLIADSYK